MKTRICVMCSEIKTGKHRYCGCQYQCRFSAPVFFSDDLVIHISVIHLGHKSFTLLQRAVNKASGVLKCQCRTIMVGYDVASKEPVELPADFKRAICDYEGKTLEELSQPLK